MKILLICSAGMSTSLLVNSMKKVAGPGDVIEAKPVSELNTVVDRWDVVLVGPQVRYKLAEVQKLCRAHGKKADVIDMMAYGQMNGQAAMKQARALYETGRNR